MKNRLGIPKKLYVAKFSSRELQHSYHRIPNYKGQFVYMTSEEGYPTNVKSFENATIFSSKEGCEHLVKGFPEIDCYELKISLKKVKKCPTK